MAKIIIATEKQSVTAAAKPKHTPEQKKHFKASKARLKLMANRAALGTLQGTLKDASAQYETMSDSVDNIGEQIDVVEAALEMTWSEIPLTKAGAKAVGSALKDFAKAQKAALAAVQKAQKAMSKVVAAAEKGKMPPAPEAPEEQEEETSDEE